ncbi:hypothetical protein JCM10207_008712 [Rhodosporidiobolus poonsookiae]
MPPSRSHPSSSASSNSGDASAQPASRRRKGTPVKAPARAAPYPPSTSTPRAAPSAVNAPVLLKLILRDADRPVSEVDNRRHKVEVASSKLLMKKKTASGSRDVLLPAQEGFGRGHSRVRKAGLAADYIDLSAGFPGSRGRSPGARGKNKDLHPPPPHSSNPRAYSAGAPPARPSHLNHPSYPPSYASDYLAVPGPGPASTNSGRMSRAVSAGGIAPVAAYPATSAAYAAPVPSPLARSFSASGATTTDREARMRTPSNPHGVARVAELGGQGFDYALAPSYVAA